jgi:hypothetical protein
MRPRTENNFWSAQHTQSFLEADLSDRQGTAMRESISLLKQLGFFD